MHDALGSISPAHFGVAFSLLVHALACGPSAAEREQHERALAEAEAKNAATQTAAAEAEGIAKAAAQRVVKTLGPLAAKVGEPQLAGVPECTSALLSKSPKRPLAIGGGTVDTLASPKGAEGWKVSAYDSHTVWRALETRNPNGSDDDGIAKAVQTIEGTKQLVVIRETGIVRPETNETMQTYKAGSVDVVGVFVAEGAPVCKLAVHTDSPKEMTIAKRDVEGIADLDLESRLRTLAAEALSKRLAEVSGGAIESLDLDFSEPK